MNIDQNKTKIDMIHGSSKMMLKIIFKSRQLTIKGHYAETQLSSLKPYKFLINIGELHDQKPFHIVMELCCDLYHVLVQELKKCPNFRHGFLSWVFHIGKEKHQIDLKGFGSVKIFPIITNTDRHEKKFKFKITIQSTQELKKLAFDKELLCWSILSPYILQKMQNEYVSSYLSTLGGAYSALGDYFHKHAKTAGMISKKQYILATKMNDPAQRLRCQLFYSFSLMQCNKMKAARKLIKYVHQQCKALLVDTSLVETCCQAAWSKYKYLRSLRNRIS
eukprot:TCONS_00009690-protein